MDYTLASLIQHMVQSDMERARLAERVKQLEGENESLLAENRSLHDELDALHAEQK